MPEKVDNLVYDTVINLRPFDQALRDIERRYENLKRKLESNGIKISVDVLGAPGSFGANQSAGLGVGGLAIGAALVRQQQMLASQQRAVGTQMAPTSTVVGGGGGAASPVNNFYYGGGGGRGVTVQGRPCERCGMANPTSGRYCVRCGQDSYTRTQRFLTDNPAGRVIGFAGNVASDVGNAAVAGTRGAMFVGRVGMGVARGVYSGISAVNAAIDNYVNPPKPPSTLDDVIGWQKATGHATVNAINSLAASLGGRPPHRRPRGPRGGGGGGREGFGGRPFTHEALQISGADDPMLDWIGVPVARASQKYETVVTHTGERVRLTPEESAEMARITAGQTSMGIDSQGRPFASVETVTGSKTLTGVSPVLPYALRGDGGRNVVFDPARVTNVRWRGAGGYGGVDVPSRPFDPLMPSSMSAMQVGRIPRAGVLYSAFANVGRFAGEPTAESLAPTGLTHSMARESGSHGKASFTDADAALKRLAASANAAAAGLGQTASAARGGTIGNLFGVGGGKSPVQGPLLPNGGFSPPGFWNRALFNGGNAGGRGGGTNFLNTPLDPFGLGGGDKLGLGKLGTLVTVGALAQGVSKFGDARMSAAVMSDKMNRGEITDPNAVFESAIGSMRGWSSVSGFLASMPLLGGATKSAFNFLEAERFAQIHTQEAEGQRRFIAHKATRGGDVSALGMGYDARIMNETDPIRRIQLQTARDAAMLDEQRTDETLAISMAGGDPTKLDEAYTARIAATQRAGRRQQDTVQRQFNYSWQAVTYRGVDDRRADLAGIEAQFDPNDPLQARMRDANVFAYNRQYMRDTRNIAQQGNVGYLQAFGFNRSAAILSNEYARNRALEGVMDPNRRTAIGHQYDSNLAGIGRQFEISVKSLDSTISSLARTLGGDPLGGGISAIRDQTALNIMQNPEQRSQYERLGAMQEWEYRRNVGRSRFMWAEGTTSIDSSTRQINLLAANRPISAEVEGVLSGALGAMRSVDPDATPEQRQSRIDAVRRNAMARLSLIRQGQMNQMQVEEVGPGINFGNISTDNYEAEIRRAQRRLRSEDGSGITTAFANDAVSETGREAAQSQQQVGDSSGPQEVILDSQAIALLQALVQNTSNLGGARAQ